MSENKLITINARKFDGAIHRSWKAEMIAEHEEYYLLLGVFESEIRHPNLGVIRRNTLSYEYYWKEKWFSIFRFHEPEGDLRNYYCNVNQPPIFREETLDYIDLDLDILVWKDFTSEVLDMDEFESNIIRYQYPVEIQDMAYKGLGSLISMIDNKQFPFNFVH